MSSEQRTFQARRELPHALMVVGIFALGGFLIWQHSSIPLPLADKFGWFFVLFGVLASWDWLSTSYEINQAELIVIGGLSRDRIPLETIEEVRPRGSKVRVTYQKYHGTGHLTVAPKNQSAFMHRLYQKAPWLMRQAMLASQVGRS